MTGTELGHVVDTRTGEVVERDVPAALLADEEAARAIVQQADDVMLAHWLDGARAFENRLKAMKKTISREVIARMDRSQGWTREVAPGIKLSSQSPERFAWDAEAVDRVLAELVDDDLLPADAVERGIRREVVLKPQDGELKRMMKLGGRVKAELQTCRVPVEKDRTVSISRAS